MISQTLQTCKMWIPNISSKLRHHHVVTKELQSRPLGIEENIQFLSLKFFDCSDLIQMTKTIGTEKLFSFLAPVLPDFFWTNKMFSDLVRKTFVRSLSYFLFSMELQSTACIVWDCHWSKRKIYIENLLHLMPVILKHH